MKKIEKMLLGDLILEMHRLAFEESAVLFRDEKDIPEHSLKKYRRYQEIVEELNRREKEVFYSKHQSYDPKKGTIL